MRRFAGILALLLFLTACGQTAAETEPVAGTSSVRPAVSEGETLSPDGRFLVRAEGIREDATGLCPAEKVRIMDAETGEILWEGDGARILWSPEGGFAALARTLQTGCSITILETEGWTGWEFALPDGSGLPEYAVLPDGEPWGVWRSEGGLNLAVDGDGEERSYYACAVEMREGRLRGTAWKERHETLPGNYDFDHNGEPEIVELVTVFGDEAKNQVGWYELRVRTEGLYWNVSFAEAHPGWGSCFACRVDGEDYLLRCTPTMYQGVADYVYQLFSLSETGEEEVVRTGNVEFDVNFGSPMHDSFDPEAIAAFLEEVRGLLEDSELLLSTEGGEFRAGGPGGEFLDVLNPWTGDPRYDAERSLAENIRAIEGQ